MKPLFTVNLSKHFSKFTARPHLVSRFFGGACLRNFGGACFRKMVKPHKSISGPASAESFPEKKTGTRGGEVKG